MTQRREIGIVAVVLYMGTVVAANYFVQHVGTQPFPGGPHTIAVGFGQRAPSGVLWVGLAFTLRDAVQSTLGRRWAVLAILAGAVLSYAVAPSLAWGAACAIQRSEIYTPLVERNRVVPAVLLSNTLGLLLDTFVFLWLAFHSLDFWQGQVIGKAWMTLLALVILVPARQIWSRPARRNASATAR